MTKLLDITATIAALFLSARGFWENNYEAGIAWGCCFLLYSADLAKGN